MKPKLVSLDTLGKLFGDNPPDRPVIIRKTCSECGRDVEIELHKTSGGFGLQGGILIDLDGHIAADCPKCYKKHTVALV